MTILSVDDSTTIRRIVKRSCEEMGHTVLEAAEGAAALAVLAEKASEVSLVILDWNMPGMTGLEVLKAIKSDPKTKNYLTKPFDQKMLALKIQESAGMLPA